MTTQREEIVKGKTFSEPFQGAVNESTPTHGLFQLCYNLSEADFLRLQQSSPVLASIGAAITSFSLSYLFPGLVQYYLTPKTTRGPFPQTTLWVGGSSLLLGAIILGSSLFASKERRKVLKRIRAHFKNNPSELEYRQ